MSPWCQALHLHSKAGNTSSLFYRYGNWGLREFRDLSQITEPAQLTRRFIATVWGTSQTLSKWVLGPPFYGLRKWGPKQFSIMSGSQTVKRRTGMRILACSTLKFWVPSPATSNSRTYIFFFFWGFGIHNPAGKQIGCSYGDIYVVPLGHPPSTAMLQPVICPQPVSLFPGPLIWVMEPRSLCIGFRRLVDRLGWKKLDHHFQKNSNKNSAFSFILSVGKNSQ